MDLLDRIGSLPAYRDLINRVESGLETVENARGLGIGAFCPPAPGRQAA